jgi:3-dehydroquinate synthase
MCSASEPGNIVLVGFMGAGKSTVARELHRLGGLTVVDLDELIVSRSGRSIPEIFHEEGEQGFRNRESEALKSLSGCRGTVIATGGGVVGREENWAVMRALGKVVYLRAGWPTLQSRLADGEGRPLADGGDWERVEALWRRRLPLYGQADLAIDTAGLEAPQVARQILQRLGRTVEEQGVTERLVVGLGERSYPIWVGEGILDRLGEALAQTGFPRQVAVVTNPTVQALYADRALAALAAAGFRAATIVIPDGEEYKTLRTLEGIYDALIEGGYDRHCGLVALGGGVVGDITGFAAATYLRGVPFAQVPTTLLAQVDSSVGGKTAVNHPLGKNLIGAFCQPCHVHIDVATLDSLPEREFAAGMAEVIKYGVIRDAAFFGWLGTACEGLRRRERPALIRAVGRSCQIKADIVEQDETERDLRAVLNYGHTFGHAVETLTGYGEFRHGEAVAIGMHVAARVSAELGFCSADDVAVIRNLIEAFGLPVTPPDFSLDDYLRAMGRDKKVRAGVLRLVLNRGIGDCLVQPVDDPEVLFATVLRPFQRAR